MNRFTTRYLVIVLLLLCGAPVTFAQYGSGNVHLPYESQAASVSQTIGLTQMTITYHRPGVKGRTIWGDLVPYNDGKPFPWRGGANENTTISFSTDVTIEGHPMTAGTYGLHFIPSANSWIVIFSKNYTSWGSFSYNESEDALRITVKPTVAPFEEYLTYRFVNPKPNTVEAQLHWEKLAVSFEIGVDLGKTVLASIRNELRNTAGFSWKGYNSAASFCADNKIELEQGLAWADRSVASEERFENLETKSEILRLMGKTADADATLKTAMQKATAMDLYSYGRGLLSDGKPQEAMVVFKENAKNHPDEWFVYAGLARGYEALEDLPNAITQMKLALTKAPERSKPSISATISQWETKLKK